MENIEQKTPLTAFCCFFTALIEWSWIWSGPRNTSTTVDVVSFSIVVNQWDPIYQYSGPTKELALVSQESTCTFQPLWGVLHFGLYQLGGAQLALNHTIWLNGKQCAHFVSLRVLCALWVEGAHRQVSLHMLRGVHAWLPSCDSSLDNWLSFFPAGLRRVTD